MAAVLLAAGCGHRGSSPAAAGRMVGTKEWTTAQGSTMTSALRVIPIDSESTGAAVHVKHATKSPDQKPIEKLELRFAQEGGPTEWIEIPQAGAASSSGNMGQTFEMPFSAPTPIKMDFRVTVAGKAEELLGWNVSLD